jgi:serine/threonine protein kinase
VTNGTATDHVDQLGPYRLEGLLGRGGMGEVYRAFDTRRGRVVALKVLPAELAHDESFRVRFRRESDSAARLQDPHVIPIHDFGEIDGRLYIDMRFVDGVGLDRLIASGPLDPRRAVALITQAAEALADAHAHAVLHRDVKPSNILVTRSDFVYLVDFGIARALDDNLTALTRSGVTVGTLAYMAPERFDGGAFDARSDIYSLACTLAECLTGRKPFDATSLPSLMKAHLTAEPPRPSLVRRDVPPAFDEVIARGMAKDPSARYPTARDLAAAAQYALSQWSPQPAPAATVLPHGRRGGSAARQFQAAPARRRSDPADSGRGRHRLRRRSLLRARAFERRAYRGAVGTSGHRGTSAHCDSTSLDPLGPADARSRADQDRGRSSSRLRLHRRVQLPSLSGVHRQQRGPDQCLLGVHTLAAGRGHRCMGC